MSLRRWMIASFVAGAAFGTAFPVAAAGPDRVELTLFAGYRFGGEIDSLDYDFDFGRSVDVNEGGSFGVNLAIPVGAGFHVELLGSRQSSDFEIDEGIFEPSEEVGDIDVTYLHAGIAYTWDLGRVRPFVAASLGATLLEPDLPGVDRETQPSAALGGGVKLQLGEHLGLRIEGRGFYTDVDDADDDRNCRFCDEDDEAVLSQGEVSIGLVFRF